MVLHFDPAKYRLRSQSFFDLLAPKDVKRVKLAIERKEYKKGQVLIREGNYSKGVYIVRKGKVKIYGSNDAGKETVIYIYRKSEFFGYRPLLNDEPNPVTATAIEATLVDFIPRETIEKLLDTSHAFVRNLMLCLAREFTVWINKIMLFSQFDVKERVALAILILSGYDPGADDSLQTRTLNLGRDDLSSYVGTAKETLVRALRLFKDRGFIEARGSTIVIKKPRELLESFQY